MRKQSILLFLLLLPVLDAPAQGRTETIVLATDKPTYGSYDTLYVSGMLISPDAAECSKLSNYCFVELFNERDTIMARQKVRCEGSLFHARFPLADIRESQYLLVRAYTHFMQNFTSRTWPVVVSGVAESGKKPIIPPASIEQGNLQITLSRGVLLYKYTPTEDTTEAYRLSFYAGGHRLGTVDVPPSAREGSCRPDSIGSDLICGILTDDKGRIVASRFLPPERTVPVKIETEVVSSERNTPIQITLTAEQDISLLLRIEKAEAPSASLLQKAIGRFMRLGAEEMGKIWERSYPYAYPPEQLLTFRGTVKTEMGARFTKEGSVIAFNNETGHTYDGDIDAEGNYIVGVDDFKDGNTFFLQAYNKKGKNNFYTVEPEEYPLPKAYLPKVTLVDASEYNTTYRPSVTVDTMRLHELSEVKVTAPFLDKDALTQRYYNTNYFDHAEIKKRGYVNMEHILRAMRGVIVQGGFITRTRGPGSLPGNQGDNGESNSSKVAKEAIPFIVDGAWIECTYDGKISKMEGGGVPAYFLETIVSVPDIATIEYIPSPRSAILYGGKAFQGAIVITTRSGKNKDMTPVPSRGTQYEPLGLSDNRPFPEKIPLRSLTLRAGESRTVSFLAPAEAGKYRIVAEGIGQNHVMVCKEVNIEVK